VHYLYWEVSTSANILRGGSRQLPLCTQIGWCPPPTVMGIARTFTMRNHVKPCKWGTRDAAHQVGQKQRHSRNVLNGTDVLKSPLVR
jgi:hypothetical protein